MEERSPPTGARIPIELFSFIFEMNLEDQFLPISICELLGM
jgi:hypothetical protein